jgi:hypothetical protein
MKSRPFFAFSQKGAAANERRATRHITQKIFPSASLARSCGFTKMHVIRFYIPDAYSKFRQPQDLGRTSPLGADPFPAGVLCLCSAYLEF